MADASTAPGAGAGPPGPATPPRCAAKPARARRRPRAQLLPPVALANAIEASVHQCSRALIEELKLVIPPANTVLACAGREGKPPLLAVPTAQRTEADLTEWGDRAAKEKDECLEKVRTAQSQCTQLLWRLGAVLLNRRAGNGARWALGLTSFARSCGRVWPTHGARSLGCVPLGFPRSLRRGRTACATS